MKATPQMVRDAFRKVFPPMYGAKNFEAELLYYRYLLAPPDAQQAVWIELQKDSAEVDAALTASASAKERTP